MTASVSAAITAASRRLAGSGGWFVHHAREPHHAAGSLDGELVLAHQHLGDLSLRGRPYSFRFRTSLIAAFSSARSASACRFSFAITERETRSRLTSDRCECSYARNGRDYRRRPLADSDVGDSWSSPYLEKHHDRMLRPRKPNVNESFWPPFAHLRAKYMTGRGATPSPPRYRASSAGWEHAKTRHRNRSSSRAVRYAITSIELWDTTRSRLFESQTC